MYREEKVIDGILHWRSQPDGVWYQYTLQALTERITQIQRELVKINEFLEISVIR
jgi:hypothetical protein